MNKSILPLAFAAPLALYGYKHYSKEKKGGSKEQVEKKKSGERNVLPTNVTPTHYVVDLTPNLITFAVKGKVTVTLTVNQPTSVITLNSKGLKFSQAFVSANGQAMVSRSVSFDTQNDTASLHFGSTFPIGTLILTINFDGELSEQLNGFYRSKYTATSGETRYMGTTQFEATHARQAFPCWDEPLLKSRFEIVLRVPKDRVAISNMPVVEEKELEGIKVVRYAPTPLVSTYLLAWCVGEFEYIETKTQEGVVVRVYTQIGKTKQGEFGLECGKRMLSFFSDYFDIGFPLPKLDMIAIPDFAAGAMENWGLVTYRETALLYEHGVSSEAAKARVAYVVAHELAHQWFGNLVSPSWWKYLWLNEGFATWAGVLAVDHCFPEWDQWTKFVADYVFSAFSVDSLESSHPIEVEVQDAGSISEIFDAISYYKGSSVIRMLAHYLGADTFRDALRTYLKEKQYACASTEDLWRHCSLASGKDVPAVMDNWIKITGYPYITVKQLPSKDPTKITLSFAQQLFLSTGVSEENNGGTVWCCPMVVSVGSTSDVTATTTTKFEFSTKRGCFDVVLPMGVSVEGKDWFVKVNQDCCSFFRVKYDQQLTDRLAPMISRLPSSVDRMSIQNDVFAMAKAGAASTVDALAMSAGYRQEKDQPIWQDLTSNLATLRNLYEQEGLPSTGDFKKFIVWLYNDIITAIGWEATPGESQSDTLLRSLVLTTAGKSGHKDVIVEAKKRFVDHVAGTKEINADIRTCVYTLAMVHGGEKEFEELLSLYDKTDLAEEKVRILQTLGNTPNKAKLLQLLNMLLGGGQVRNQDAVYVVSSVAGNPHGRQVAFDWVKKNWATIVDKWGGGQMMLPSFVKGVCGGFASEAKLKEVTAFFDGKPLPGAERSLLQAKEQISMLSRWIERDSKQAAQWLANGPHKK